MNDGPKPRDYWTAMLKGSCLVLFLGMILFTAPVVAADTEQFDRAVNAVTNALPSGWTLADRKTNEIPAGHHWNENYAGPKGLLLIVKGIRPVDAEFSDTNDTWHAVHVATESLKIWLMPSRPHAHGHIGTGKARVAWLLDGCLTRETVPSDTSRSWALFKSGAESLSCSQWT
jgi:hypothetical protein